STHLLVCRFGSRPPPDLHSFPTRRSSDLPRGTLLPCPSAGHPAVALILSGEDDQPMPPPTLFQAYGCSASADAALQQKRIARRLDRKSTRLNSSHVKISYAVFCLKKKNTT